MFSVYIILLLNLIIVSLHTVYADPPDDTERPASKEVDELAKFGPEIHCKFQSLTFICGDRQASRGFFYDMQLQECSPTTYGHCKHAYNNFKTKTECKSTCGDKAHHLHPKNLSENVACRLQPEFGDCHQYHPRFFFDVNTGSCRGFSYSGCGGNYNRFPSVSVCKAVCVPYIKHEEDN